MSKSRLESHKADGRTIDVDRCRLENIEIRDKLKFQRATQAIAKRLNGRVAEHGLDNFW